jgi:hypothetical protein
MSWNEKFNKWWPLVAYDRTRDLAISFIRTEIIGQMLEDSKTMNYEQLTAKWKEESTSKKE